jgi:inner membrane transporter RhtA
VSALSNVEGSYPGAAGSGRAGSGGAGWGRAGLDAIPPPGLILLGIVSVQVGAGLAKNLFGLLPPAAVVTMRLSTSAIVLVCVARPRLRTMSLRDLGLAATFGLNLAAMNLSFYEAMARIPLGVAVTIEFLGPLSVAIIASRRRRDLAWAAIAAGGVLLLARGGGGSLSATGVGLALLAAVGWAAYIFLSAATGRRFAGTSGLAIASVVGSAVLLPVGIGSAGTALLRPELLAIGAGVGLLSSVIPYTLEMEALRKVPAGVFGILMSLEPAVAALVGLVFLGEILSWKEWLAIGCVILACAGAARSGRPPPPEV